MQTGFSTYEPQHCEWRPFFDYAELNSLVKKADVVISHGGPATFMGAIGYGKRPIVVPRLKRFGEHINNHQVRFAERILRDGYDIKLVEDIDDLYRTICNVQQQNKGIKFYSHNEAFINEFKKIAVDLVQNDQDAEEFHKHC